MFDRGGNLIINLDGQEGNAFAILGSITGVMKANGYDKEQIKYWMGKMKSGDYENLCRVADEAFMEVWGEPIQWRYDGDEITLNEFFSDIYSLVKEEE